MTFLDDLISISDATGRNQAADAVMAISMHIKMILDNATYTYPADAKTMDEPRIYSEAEKNKLIKLFRDEYKSIVLAKQGSGNPIKNLGDTIDDKYAQICSAMLKDPQFNICQTNIFKDVLEVAINKPASKAELKDEKNETQEAGQINTNYPRMRHHTLFRPADKSAISGAIGDIPSEISNVIAEYAYISKPVRNAVNMFDEYVSNLNSEYRDNLVKALLTFLMTGGFEFIKSYEDVCNLASLLQIKGYAIPNPPCTPVEFIQAILDMRDSIASKVETSFQMPRDARLDLAAEIIVNEMNNSMKQITEESDVSEERLALEESDDEDFHSNKILLNFLHGKNGFKLVRTYEELCDLSEKLLEKGVNTANALCTPLEFAEVFYDMIGKLEPYIYGSPEPEVPDKARLEWSVKELEKCIDYDEHFFENINDEKPGMIIIKLLRSKFKSFDELCEVTRMLQEKGYEIQNPPCEPIEYANAMVANTNKPEKYLPKDARFLLAMNHIKEWIPEHKNESNKNKLLLNFFIEQAENGNHYYIQNYNELCEISSKLQKEYKEYPITNPLCTEHDFVRAFVEALDDDMIVLEKMPDLPVEAKLQYIANLFDKQMKSEIDLYENNFAHNTELADYVHNIALNEYLSNSKMDLFINSYDELCNLAYKVKKLGYKTTIPPVTPDMMQPEDLASRFNNSSPHVNLHRR